MIKCPLCLSHKGFTMLKGPDTRTYRCCDSCRLIFTDTRRQATKKEDEKKHGQRDSGQQSPAYVKFLKQAIEPTLPLLTPDMKGLDFICGPEPALHKLLEQDGISCDNYDPVFFPDIPEKEYDFIFTTESFEHFFLPAKELQQIKNLLKTGGFFTVLTELWTNPDAFAKWSYAKDATRVTFFHRITLEYICEKYGFTLLPVDQSNVNIFRKEPVQEKVAEPEK